MGSITVFWVILSIDKIIVCRTGENKILGSKYLLLKHDISARNEGKHVLATSIVQNFSGRSDACGVTKRLSRCRSHSLPKNQLESSQRTKIKFWSASSNPVGCLASPNTGDFARKKSPTGGEIQELWNAQLAKSPHQPSPFLGAGPLKKWKQLLESCKLGGLCYYPYLHHCVHLCWWILLYHHVSSLDPLCILCDSLQD